MLVAQEYPLPLLRRAWPLVVI